MEIVFLISILLHILLSSRSNGGVRRTKEHTIFIEAYVHKSKSVPQTVSAISSKG
jgi:hypothetical protein